MTSHQHAGRGGSRAGGGGGQKEVHYLQTVRGVGSSRTRYECRRNHRRNRGILP